MFKVFIVCDKIYINKTCENSHYKETTNMKEKWIKPELMELSVNKTENGLFESPTEWSTTFSSYHPTS